MKVAFGIMLVLVIPLAGYVLTDAPIIWPLSALIYNVGLLYSFDPAPRKTTSFILYIIAAVTFFVIESAFFFSYYLQNSGFNAAFFYHLRPDLLFAGVKEYLPVLLLMVTCLLGFLILCTTGPVPKKPGYGALFPLSVGFLVGGLLLSPSVKSLALHIQSSLSANPDNIVLESFQELRDQQITIEFARSKKPNIVLIYAESLEQRFFDETLFPNLVPHLQALSQQSINFANVSQGPGAGWTVGGIVASQCGYPLAGSQGVRDNDLSIFDRFMPKATCLGDLLTKDGYHLTFIGGADGRFAGKAHFLASHGYAEVIDRHQLQKSLADKSYLNAWGVYDDTLLDYAIEKFIALSQKKSPFLLTLLTLDAHGTSGSLSRSCGVYRSGDNSSLNSFHCSDRLIADFIKLIRSSPFSGDTLIIVLSDHLAMRNKATPLLEASQKPRRLTFFVNTPDSQKAENTNPGLHYDIAPTILDLVGYKINGQMGFGAPLTKGPGYLPGQFGKNRWREQTPNLLAVASSLWDNEVKLDRTGIKFTRDDMSLTFGGKKFNISSEGYTNIPASTLFFFDEKSLNLEKIRFYSLDRGLTKGTLSQELLEHKEKLALAIGRPGNLPGFADPQTDPKEWVYFFGKPGSDIFSRGVLTETLIIPFDIIPVLLNGQLDARIIRQRENLLINQRSR